jgi:wyosine [tRNA(Phe)-imidazoG37] synthetase (radical SAM superfamily)
MTSSSPPRAPGDGADRPALHAFEREYVYVARSRRAGGLSLGIDLTPHGHCSFSCVYCQASHPPVRDPNLTIDLQRLREELHHRLSSSQATDLRDLVFAGSGEPTAALNFCDVVDVILEVCNKAGFDRPRKVFTNARHLDRDRVTDALVRWIDAQGEVWVKFDGATDATLRAINGRTLDAASHLRGIWSFASRRAIGLQTMLVQGPHIPSPDTVFDEVLRALQDGLTIGAKITAVHLLTLARTPSDPTQAETLFAISTERLEAFAKRMRDQTHLGVTVYGSG